MPFIYDTPPFLTVAMPLLATGDRRVLPAEMLKPLLEAASQWMSKGLPIQHLKIVEINEQKAQELARLFREAKEENAQLKSKLPDQCAYELFVSYQRSHVDYVKFMNDELIKKDPNVRIFIDILELRPGMPWQHKIYEAIYKCKMVVPLFSPAYLESKMCLEEYNLARVKDRDSKHEVLFPVYLFTANLPSYMRDFHYVDCREGDHQKLSQMCEHILEQLDKARHNLH